MALLLAAATGCTAVMTYDDSALTSRIAALEGRTKELALRVDGMSQEIANFAGRPVAPAVAVDATAVEKMKASLDAIKRELGELRARASARFRRKSVPPPAGMEGREAKALRQKALKAKRERKQKDPNAQKRTRKPRDPNKVRTPRKTREGKAREAKPPAGQPDFGGGPVW